MLHTRRQELIFRALANDLRRRILDSLKDQPRTTGDLCSKFKKFDRCTVMQHLAVLERAELIIVKREGRLRWNYLNVTPIKEIYDRWINQYASGAVRLLTKLKRDLER